MEFHINLSGGYARHRKYFIHLTSESRRERSGARVRVMRFPPQHLEGPQKLG
ncbi:hypothetical protein PMIT1306_00743 [Prochlorococcus sp. MIT 1306]|nr:hypothetical protein PMIT1306_00743 [Prochlorococcus sp. MIT 1306]